jgi:hypothetical protein
MSLWGLWFWVLLVFFVELASSRFATYALALALGAVLALAAFLYSWELDLFATVILTTYASVFTLLALLLIQFTSLGGEAASRGHRVTSVFILAAAVVLMGICFGSLPLAPGSD